MKTFVWTAVFAVVIGAGWIDATQGNADIPSPATTLGPATTITRLPTQSVNSLPTQCVTDPNTCSGMGWQEEPDEIIEGSR